MMKLYRFGLFNVCPVPGPGIRAAAGTLVGSGSSGSTGLGLAGGFYPAKYEEGHSFCLLRAMVSFVPLSL